MAGKITYIKKARKSRVCGRCGKEIQAGKSYWKGERNFCPDVIRCEKCGIKQWEMTSSEYAASVLQLIEEWSDGLKIRDFLEDPQSIIDGIAASLEEIKDSEQEKLYNLPEQLQCAPVGELIEGRIQSLDECIDCLNDIDVENIQEQVAEEVLADEGMEVKFDWEGAEKFLKKYHKLAALADLHESFESLLSEEIDKALDVLDV